MRQDRFFPRILRARLHVWLIAALLAGAGQAFVPVPAAAQEHAATADTQKSAEGKTAEGEQSEGLLPVAAKLLNFALLVGVLAYFLKAPVVTYLASRATQIRQDLVSARDTRAAAEAQLAAVERRLRELPAELELLKAQGAQDLRAEQARITQAVAAERARLVEQTRREIEMRLRIARRDLTERAAQLAVSIAEQRIKRSITADDQLRLIDRYTSQLQEAR